MTERTPEQNDGGLMGSLRRFGGTALELLRTRIELLAVEFEQEKLRVFDALLLAGLAAVLLGVGALLLVGLVVAMFWDGHPLLALGVPGAVFLAGAGITARAARRRLRNAAGPLPASIAELDADQDALAGPG